MDNSTTFLYKGQTFLKRFESGGIQNCTLKVDEDFMFLSWKFESSLKIEMLELTHIREVSRGVKLKDLRALFELAEENEQNLSNRILTVYHGIEFGNISITQFISPTLANAEKWENCLNQVLRYRIGKYFCLSDILKKQWLRLQLSLNSRGMIPIRKLMKNFSSDKNEKAILEKLKTCGFSYSKNEEINPKELTFEEYKKMHKKICVREDLKKMFKEISKDKDHIETDTLVSWLNKNQRDPRLNEILNPTFDTKSATAIIQKYETSSKYLKMGWMSLQGLSNYLSSGDNALIYLEHLNLYQDMDQPLSHYFINSSHNTYLTGRQLGGKSSVEIYRHILLSGCRCIELDCWDGKGLAHGEPIITHGKAMCSDVPFKAVLYAIKETAFVTSEYPVILSFETHCSKPLQNKMAKYCEEVFGPMLLNKPLDFALLDPGVCLPSPNALKRKILIKNKRLDSETEQNQLESIKNEALAFLEEESEEAHPELLTTKSLGLSSSSFSTLTNNAKSERQVECDPSIQNQALKKHLTVRNMFNDGDPNKKSMKKDIVLSEEDERELAQKYEYVQTSLTNIHPCLSALVNYCQSVKFPGFKKVQEDFNQKKCFQMSSFSESAGVSHLKCNAVEFVNYNKNQMSRIYPKGARVESSNYTPQIFWNAGCQLVSLNFQTSDLGMQLNMGKFEYNGSCGYLLKPEMLIKENRNFDLFAEGTVDGVIAAQCGINVISAQYVADRPVSTYVEVEMYGLPNDTIRKEFRTNLILNNGLNPQYNYEILFRKIIFPDLALLRFTLCDDSRQILGQRVIPLNSLQTGYRYITLKTTSGIPLDQTTLFVKIALKSYVPDSLLEFASALENPKAHQESLRIQHENQLRRLDDDIESSDTTSITGTPTAQKPSNSSTLGGGKDQLEAGSPGLIQDRKVGNFNSSYSSFHQPHKSIMIKSSLDTIEESILTIDQLLSHPVYTKAIEDHKKESVKQRKKQNKLENKKSESENNKSSGIFKTCCFLRLLKGKEKFNGDITEKDSDTIIENGICSPPSIKKKDALFGALEKIHFDNFSQLKADHVKEMADLEKNQIKQLMESSKQINRNKTIQHSERGRRIRELKSEEVKKFMEERQLVKMQHSKQIEKLETKQNNEAEKVKKIIHSHLALNKK